MVEKPKILIVDDKEANLLALETLLNEFEVIIVKALSGNEALKQTLNHDFALALIDVQMPEMDGYETLEFLRASKSTKFLPVIFVSAIFSDEFYVIKGIESGAVDFITKPINVQILNGKVKVFLDLYIERKKLELEISNRKKIESDLEIAIKDAKSANNSKSMFLATMSHEIRTPLNGVLGMTDIILQTELSAQQEEYINIIRLSGQNLLSIVNDILDFSKIESGQVVLENIQVNLLNLANEMRTVFEFKAKEKNIEIYVDVDKELPSCILGDPARIKQILINFIGNALKFTDKGSITIKINHLTTNEETAEIKFEIIDTGIGISKEGRSKLFKAFSQSDISIFRKFGGTGLGLSISKNLVDLMGGQIGVNSVEGEGSSFWFTGLFTKSQEASKEDSIKSGTDDLDAPKKIKILVAEDNIINQKVVIYNLKDLGFEADIVNNGEEAVEYFKKNFYNLILMDIQMPVMDGLVATRKIREFEEKNLETKKAYIIALTANVLKEDQEKYRECGMNDHISKPFQKEDLKKVIDIL